MKKIAKENIFSFVLGAIIFGAISGVVTYTLTAQEVGFTPKDTTWEVDDTKSALDDLYSVFYDKNKLEIYGGMTWKTGTGWNNTGFVKDLFINTKYIQKSGETIIFKRNCKIKASVLINTSAAQSSAPTYSLIYNGSSVLYFSGAKSSNSVTTNSVTLNVNKGASMYAQVYGGGSATNIFITTIEITK